MHIVPFFLLKTMNESLLTLQLWAALPTFPGTWGPVIPSQIRNFISMQHLPPSYVACREQ